MVAVLIGEHSRNRKDATPGVFSNKSFANAAFPAPVETSVSSLPWARLLWSVYPVTRANFLSRLMADTGHLTPNAWQSPRTMVRSGIPSSLIDRTMIGSELSERIATLSDFKVRETVTTKAQVTHAFQMLHHCTVKMNAFLLSLSTSHRECRLLSPFDQGSSEERQRIRGLALLDLAQR